VAYIEEKGVKSRQSGTGEGGKLGSQEKLDHFGAGWGWGGGVAPDQHREAKKSLSLTFKINAGNQKLRVREYTERKGCDAGDTQKLWQNKTKKKKKQTT